MINSLKLSGTVTDGYQDSPPVREIRSKKDDSVVGYSCRVKYATGTGLGWVSVTHWSPASPLKDVEAGAEISIDGTLGFESWDGQDGKRSKITVQAETITA